MSSVDGNKPAIAIRTAFDDCNILVFLCAAPTEGKLATKASVVLDTGGPMNVVSLPNDTADSLLGTLSLVYRLSAVIVKSWVLDRLDGFRQEASILRMKSVLV